MKPGYRTTEFWLTLIAALAPIVTALTGVDLTTDQEGIAQGLAGVSTLVYVVLRYRAKAVATTPAVPAAGEGDPPASSAQG